MKVENEPVAERSVIAEPVKVVIQGRLLSECETSVLRISDVSLENEPCFRAGCF